MQTPLEVEILIHYYCSARDYPNLDAPSVKSAIDNFVKLGLLIECVFDSKYQGNEIALKPYVEAVCSVPLPKQKWLV